MEENQTYLNNEYRKKSHENIKLFDFELHKTGMGVWYNSLPVNNH